MSEISSWSRNAKGITISIPIIVESNGKDDTWTRLDTISGCAGNEWGRVKFAIVQVKKDIPKAKHHSFPSTTHLITE